MRAPTRPELLLAVITVVGFGLWRVSVGSDAAKAAEILLKDAEREELLLENAVLRAERDEVDRIAADSIAQLEAVVEAAEIRATEASAAGREIFVQIIETVPDSMPELGALVERRERMHETEVVVLREIIDAERDAADVLRGQLTAANALITGIESELALAGEQIELLEDLRSPGLSTLEALGLSSGAYVIATEALGGSTLEGLIVGGTTFVVLKGGSMLLGWIF